MIILMEVLARGTSHNMHVLDPSVLLCAWRKFDQKMGRTQESDASCCYFVIIFGSMGGAVFPLRRMHGYAAAPEHENINLYCAIGTDRGGSLHIAAPYLRRRRPRICREATAAGGLCRFGLVLGDPLYFHISR